MFTAVGQYALKTCQSAHAVKKTMYGIFCSTTLLLSEGKRKKKKNQNQNPRKKKTPKLSAKKKHDKNTIKVTSASKHH